MELALLGPLPTDQFTLRILLVEDNPGDARMVRETLASQSIVRFEVILASRLGEGLICLNGEQFDAVLLDLSLPDARGLDTLARMRRRAPFIPIVIMTGLSDEALAMKALNEGAQDYLVKGENDAPALARRIRFAIERSRGSSTRPLNEAQPRTCRTLGFIGSKGGVGASTLSCHLALAMRGLSKEPLLLADFDFKSGILDFLMEVDPKFTVTDALHNAERLDEALWSSMVREKLPGLDIIASSFGAVSGEETAEQLQNVISFLRNRYRWVIGDLGSGFHGNLGGLMQEVDETYIVTTVELPALRQARLMIQELKRVGRNPDSLRLVVNELPKRSPYTSRNLEEMLGFPVWSTIPFAAELRENRQRTISQHRATNFGKAIATMAQLIVGIPEEKPKIKWPFF